MTEISKKTVIVLTDRGICAIRRQDKVTICTLFSASKTFHARKVNSNKNLVTEQQMKGRSYQSFIFAVTLYFFELFFKPTELNRD